MKINFDINVEPFFQVLVNKADKVIIAQEFYRKFHQQVSKSNKDSSLHLIKFIQPTNVTEIAEDHFFAGYLRHQRVPTWYKQEDKIDLTEGTRDILLNTEYDLIFFIRKRNTSSSIPIVTRFFLWSNKLSMHCLKMMKKNSGS